MPIVNWKPILFKNIFSKFFFLKNFDNKKVKNLVKNIAVIDYDPNTYKNLLRNGLIQKLQNHNGLFMVISNLQFAYVSNELEQHNFHVLNINFLDYLGKVNKIDEIPNSFDFFFSCKHTVNDVTYSNNSESITLNKAGTVTIKAKDSFNAYTYLKWIITAYYKSLG